MFLFLLVFLFELHTKLQSSMMKAFKMVHAGTMSLEIHFLLVLFSRGLQIWIKIITYQLRFESKISHLSLRFFIVKIWVHFMNSHSHFTNISFEPHYRCLGLLLWLWYHFKLSIHKTSHLFLIKKAALTWALTLNIETSTPLQLAITNANCFWKTTTLRRALTLYKAKGYQI